jgi:deoxyribose-phosphate aldolase
MRMPPLPAEQIASAIDHTLLDTGCGPDAIEALCDQAAVHGFAAVCVYPWWAGLARARLAGAAAVCTVVSFPHGLDRTEAKCDAAGAAIAAGADEVDVVMAWAALRAGDDAAVADDLSAVVESVRRERPDAVVKVIVESAQLTAGELGRACAAVAASGADLAKTGTGTAGACTVEAVAAMRRALPERVAIKASGGIRTAAAASAMLEAGAVRIGTSSGVAILGELEAHAVA